MDDFLKSCGEYKIESVRGKDQLQFVTKELLFEEIFRFGNIVIASQNSEDKYFESHTLLLRKNDFIYNIATKKVPTLLEIKNNLIIPKQINKEVKLSILKTLCGIKSKKKKEESEDEEEVVADDYDDNLDDNLEEDEEEDSEEGEEEEEEEIVEEDDEED